MIDIWQSLIANASDVYEPNDGYGLAGLLIIGLPALVTAAGTVWVLIRQRGVRAQVDRVAKTNSQVVNGHTEMRTELDEKFDRLGTDVQKLGTKLDAVHTLVVRHLEEHIHLKG